MIKRLCTSDWQLADNQRDKYRLDWVKNELPKLIQKYKPDQLLVLGDVTESKDNHPASLVNEIVDLFYDLQKTCYVIILQGNHDFLHKEHPYFKFVSKFDNVEWIAKPTVLDNCLYLPHTRNHKQDWKRIDFSEHEFIFAHNIFEGVKANGQKLSGIPLTIFPDSACVISGDVHEPQSFDVLTYVGSPFTTDFGDDLQPRVLLLDDLKVKSIKVGGPQKRLLNCKWSHGDFVCSDIAHEGDIVKVRVELEMQHVAEWDAIRSKIIDWTAKNKLKLYTIIPQVVYDTNDASTIVNSQRKSDDEYLSDFVKRTGIDDQTAKIGKELI